MLILLQRHVDIVFITRTHITALQGVFTCALLWHRVLQERLETAPQQRVQVHLSTQGTAHVIFIIIEGTCAGTLYNECKDYGQYSHDGTTAASAVRYQGHRAVQCTVGAVRGLHVQLSLDSLHALLCIHMV